MSPFARHLLSRSPRLTEAGAERLAAKIIAEKAERAAKQKAKLAAAQPELPLASDFPQSQGPLDEPEDQTVDF